MLNIPVGDFNQSSLPQMKLEQIVPFESYTFWFILSFVEEFAKDNFYSKSFESNTGFFCTKN